MKSKVKSKAKAILILLALTSALVPFGSDTNAGGQTRPRGRSRVVEPNERHFELNKNGEKRREFGPGQQIPDECVEIQCPNRIKNEGRGKSVKCWRCGKD
jgi:hypothetical protein